MGAALSPLSLWDLQWGVPDSTVHGGHLGRMLGYATLVATTGTRFVTKPYRYGYRTVSTRKSRDYRVRTLHVILDALVALHLQYDGRATGDLTSHATCHLPPPHLACPPAYTRPLVSSRSRKVSIATRIVVDMRLFTHFEFSSGLSTIGTE